MIILSEDLSELINKANIPEQLKTYFKESNEGKAYLNKSMLTEIEELYTFYNALYLFDETEFSFLSIADRLSQLCGVLSHRLRRLEPVIA